MRQRVEDLGRIAVLLDSCLELDIFDKYCTVRPKRIAEHFETLSPDMQAQMLRDYAYGIETIREKLCNVLSIALGQDYINAPID